MEKNEKIADILNDLIQINNDRVEGYIKAADETAAEDADLRTLFHDMASESRGYLDELKKCVASQGEDFATDTTKRGKVYRAWMDIKAAITGKNRKAILASCEFGEDAAQKAYNAALESDDLTGNARTMVTEQRAKLLKSHDKIKKMRDTQSA